MLYIYEVMKLVGYLIMKKVMRSQSYRVKMLYPPPSPLMNLPPPSGKSIFVEYHQLIVEKSPLH